MVASWVWKSTVFNIDLLPQAAKSLIYFFAEDKSAIYIVIAFSIFSPINTQPLRSSMTKVVGQGNYSKPVQLILITNVHVALFFFSQLKMNPPQFWKLWVISGDVGAIFACVAAGQALSGFATPLYNKIYIAVRMKMIKNGRGFLNADHFFFQ